MEFRKNSHLDLMICPLSKGGIMKKQLLTSMLVALPLMHVHAYESGQLSLDTPNMLNKGEQSFTIRHRFFGKVSDSEDFYGIDSGGNVMLSYRYGATDHFYLDLEHTRQDRDYSLAIGYKASTPYVDLQAEVQGYTFEKAGIEDRQNSLFYNLSLQSKPLFKHLRLTTNTAYDYYYEQFGLGLGLDLTFDNFIPALTFTEKISFLAEYYPVVDEVDGVTGKYDAYAAGIKFQTFAHHFEILISNSVDMEPRTMMRGTDTDDIHFGFNINRKF